MFKAIGRLGSHVRSLNIPFISNLFGSKSRTYSGIENDDEELFVDAQEEIHQDDGSSTCSEHVETTVSSDVADGHSSEPYSTSLIDSGNKKTAEGTEAVARVKEDNSKSDKSPIDYDAEVSVEGHSKDEHQSESDNEHDHCDKKRIVSSKKNNGSKSSSKSPFKKVHRRISSFTQKQYAKLDALRDDKKDEIKKTSENSDKEDAKENGIHSGTNDSVNTKNFDFKAQNEETVQVTNSEDINASKDSRDGGINGDVSNLTVDDESDNKMISNKQSEIKQSGSKSPFKKVHRRISSLTQRQYSKLDNTSGDNKNDNAVLKVPGTVNNSGVKLNVCHSFADMSDLEKLKKLRDTQETEENGAVQQNDNLNEVKEFTSNDTDIDDEHDDSDKKRIVSSSKSSNGKQSLSPSPFKKVHRRINSFTQRQYAKFDDNVANDADVPEAADDQDAKTDVFHSIEEIPPETDKKPKKRKKIAKRARRAARGSWKWMKRGMLQYARTFNPPSLFIINFTATSAGRRN